MRYTPFLLMLLFAGTASGEAPRDYPIKPVPFTAIKVHEGFWLPRMTTNREVTVRYDFKKCEETDVNLFVNITATVKLPENTVTLSQKTGYPWNGKVAITVKPEKAGDFALHVRIPGWALNQPIPSELYRVASRDNLDWKPSWKVNGQTQSAPLEKGYAVIRREWKAGDVVELELPMAVQRVLPHEKVVGNRPVGHVTTLATPRTPENRKSLRSIIPTKVACRARSVVVQRLSTAQATLTISHKAVDNIS